METLYLCLSSPLWHRPVKKIYLTCCWSTWTSTGTLSLNTDSFPSRTSRTISTLLPWKYRTYQISCVVSTDWWTKITLSSWFWIVDVVWLDVFDEGFKVHFTVISGDSEGFLHQRACRHKKLNLLSISSLRTFKSWRTLTSCIRFGVFPYVWAWSGFHGVLGLTGIFLMETEDLARVL